MAEKILNTRIQLKYDTLENWNSSTFILKKGEIAIVEVPTTEGSTLQPVMFKVGDGSKTFSQLDWASAKAADVFGWAKQSNLNITKVGTGNVVAGIEWDATANGGKGGVKFTTASVATSEGFEALGKDVEAIEKDIADNRAAWAKNTTYTIAKNGKGITFTPSEGDATSITFEYLTQAEIEALKVAEAGQADKVANALTIKVGGSNVEFDGSAAKTADVDAAISAAKTQLIGDASSSADSDTITGAKVYAERVQAGLIGSSSDNQAANTIYGAKKYADAMASGAASGALSDAKGYADEKFAEVLGTTNDAAGATTVHGALKAAAAAQADIDAFFASAETGKEAIDTLKEIQDFLNSDDGTVQTLIKQVDDNKNDIADIVDGTTKVKSAEHADNAAHAVTADGATQATSATDADHADIASGLDETGIAQVKSIKVNNAANADHATTAGNADYATTTSGLDAVGIAQVVDIKVNNATNADVASNAVKLGDKAAADYLLKTEAPGYADILTKTAAQTAYQPKGDYATAAQGALADSALQEIKTTANGGLKVTNKNQIDIDTNVVFVFNCGSSSTLID